MTTLYLMLLLGIYSIRYKFVILKELPQGRDVPLKVQFVQIMFWQSRGVMILASDS